MQVGSSSFPQSSSFQISFPTDPAQHDLQWALGLHEGAWWGQLQRRPCHLPKKHRREHSGSWRRMGHLSLSVSDLSPIPLLLTPCPLAFPKCSELLPSSVPCSATPSSHRAVPFHCKLSAQLTSPLRSPPELYPIPFPIHC